MHQPVGALAPRDHAVSFYATTDEGIDTVAAFVAEGLDADDRVVVVATAAHRAALRDVLAAAGADLDGAELLGRYVELDAQEALQTFMVDDTPDLDRLQASLGGLLVNTRSAGSRTRVFGEMVALLWEAGNVAGAIALESFWNELAERERFRLLCTYPASILASASVSDLSRVCGQHSVVLPPHDQAATPGAGDSADDPRTATFVPVPAAVTAVRRFVTGLLRQWGDDDLVSDAALVTSEMATNAVIHAESAFRASVGRSGGVVRIAIEDAGRGRPAAVTTTVDDLSGRGLVIVDALAERWGYEDVPDGKIVWAELLSTSGDAA